MSSHMPNVGSARFGFGLKTSFIGLFNIIGEFLSKLSRPAHYRIISTIWKQQYQNGGEETARVAL